MNRVLSAASIASLCASVAILAACSSKDPAPDNSPVGGPVATTQADTHCGTKVQAVDPATCHASPEDAGAPTSTDDAGAVAEFGATLSGSEGDDDDCKYHVKWSSTPVRENTDVTFTMLLTELATGAPSAKANPYLEVTLDDNHPAPSTGSSSEPTPGTYVIGPVRFDKPGKWTVRFHVSGDCTDAVESSPHGHAAFFVSVP